jgi:hypothetical protein
MRAGGKLVDVKTGEVGDEEEKSAAMSREIAGRQRELSHIGDGLNGRSNLCRSLFVKAAGQCSKAFVFEDLPNCGRTEALPVLSESLANLVDGAVELAQLNDAFPRTALLGL